MSDSIQSASSISSYDDYSSLRTDDHTDYLTRDDFTRYTRDDFTRFTEDEEGTDGTGDTSDDGNDAPNNDDKTNTVADTTVADTTVAGDDAMEQSVEVVPIATPTSTSNVVRASTASVQPRNKEAVPVSYHLQELLQNRQWDEARLILQRNRAGVPVPDVVSIPFRDGRRGEFPLHVICDYDWDPEGRDDGGPGDRRSSNKKQTTGETSKKGGKNQVLSKSLTGRPSEQHPPPPIDLIKLILDSFPKAAQGKGKNDSLPLHYATRGSAPKEVIEMLIKAYPHGLDMPDEFDKTPRDFYQRSSEANSFLERPTSCWIQQLIDDESRDNVEEEINALEKEVSRLMSELAEEEETEKKLMERLATMEGKITGFGDAVHGKHLEAEASEVEESLLAEVSQLEEQLGAVMAKFEAKYKPADEERLYVEAFNADIEKVYRGIDTTMHTMTTEIGALKGMLAS